jgi:hypothetical protein
MTTRVHTSLLQFLRTLFARGKRHARPEMTLAPLEPEQTQAHIVEQWPLDEAPGSASKRMTTVVEITVYPRGHQSSENYARNYTIEGEDPNLKITHYPPSNRLH